MATKPVVCPDCGALVPYGRLACAECGALLASVAGAPTRRLVRADEVDDETAILDVDAEPDVQAAGPDTHLRPSRIVRRSLGAHAAEEVRRDEAPLELAQDSRHAPDTVAGGPEAPNPDPGTSAAATDHMGESKGDLSDPPEAEVVAPHPIPTAETALPPATEEVAESMTTAPEEGAESPATDAADGEPSATEPAESGAQPTPGFEEIGQSATAPEPVASTPLPPGEPVAEEPPIDAAVAGEPVRPADVEPQGSGLVGLADSEPEPAAVVPTALETPPVLRPLLPRPALPPLPGSYLPPSEPPRVADEPWTARHSTAATAGLHPPDAGNRGPDLPGSGSRAIGARASVEPPTDAAGWVLALGALVSIVAFVLPWSSSAAGVIGASQAGTGYLDSWGLANPANLVLVLLGAFVLALVLVPNRVPTWIREGAVPIVLGGVDLGVWFTYVSSPFGDVIGVHGLLGAGGLLVGGGLLALRPGRHVRDHPRV